MNWIPINCKTHFSLQQGFCKTDKLAKRCAEYGYAACGIADIGTVSGAVEFHQECRKNGIKPIIGCEFDGFILYAKNKDGWFDLVKYVSNQNIDILKEIAENGNVLCVTPKKNGFAKIFKTNHIKMDYKKEAIYYVDKDDADCHRIMLCSKLKKTFTKIEGVEHEFSEFFDGDDRWYLPKTKKKSTTSKIADMCEEYELTGPPMLPDFDCPEGFDQNEYLKELCRHGWKKKLIPTKKVYLDVDKQEYLDRVKTELEVIFKAGLSGYFLIVQDIVNHVKDKGWIAGPGRGSAAGCLVSYLLGITEVDPIEYGLIFERFYNEGRNTDDYISLPDIDVDVPAEHRDEVIDYIKEKYGQENVSQMITFGRLQGRSALKEVLRISDAVSFSEMNEITDCIPDEAMISDQLELMDKEDRSIIRWALENESDNLNGWCKINEEGKLEGELAKFFEQAIKIEGTNKSQGKHPAGVIISKHKLKDVCPMIKDTTGKDIAGFEMNDLESQGHVKFDILAIDLLSKIMEITNKGE